MTLTSSCRNALAAFDSVEPAQVQHRDRMIALLDEPAPFARSSWAPGHFTASAFLFSPDNDAVLLIHHGKLGLWLQPGGHVEEDDPSVEAAAARELAEETGVSLEHLDSHGLFDLDIHRIPPLGDEPAHEHFDLRFAYRARRPLEPAPSAETLGARWVPLDELDRIETDLSVRGAAKRWPAIRG